MLIETEIEWSQWSPHQGIYKEVTANDACVTFSCEARLAKALSIRYSSFLVTMVGAKHTKNQTMYSYSSTR